MLAEAVETHGIAAADRDLTSRFIDHGFWDHPLLDPRTVVTGSAYLPIGPWAKCVQRPFQVLLLCSLFSAHDPLQTQLLQYVGTIMRQNCSNLHRAFHPILLKHGMSQEVLNNWSKHTQEGGSLYIPLGSIIGIETYCCRVGRVARANVTPNPVLPWKETGR